MQHSVAAGNLADRLASGEMTLGLLCQVVGQFQLAARPPATRHGVGAALARAAPDQLALGLSQVTQDRQHKPAVRRVVSTQLAFRNLRRPSW